MKNKHINYSYEYSLNSISDDDLWYASLAAESEYPYWLDDAEMNGHLDFHHPIDTISKFYSNGMESLLPSIDEESGSVFVDNLNWAKSLSQIFILSSHGLGQNCFGKKTFMHHDFT